MWTDWAISSKLLMKRAGVYNFHYRNLKLRLDLQSQKTISVLNTITISLNIQVDIFVYPSDLETTLLAYLPSNKLNYVAINLFIQQLSDLTIANFKTSTRTDITLKTSVKSLREITMVLHSTLIVGMTIGLLNFLGTCIVWIQCVRINFACTKRLSNLFKETTINVFNIRPSVKCAIFSLKNKQIRSSWSFAKGFIFLRRWKNQFKMFLEIFIVQHAPNEKCVHLSTNRTPSFYNCRKCKACSHVLNIPFKHRKPTIMLFEVDGRHCFAIKASHDYEKEKPSTFLKKFIPQSQPNINKPEPKNGKNHSS